MSKTPERDMRKESSIKRGESISPKRRSRGHKRSPSPTNHKDKSYSNSNSKKFSLVVEYSQKQEYSYGSERERDRVRINSSEKHSETKNKSRSPSRDRSPRSPRRRSRYSRSKSRSESREKYDRSRSASPMSSRRRRIGTRENPKPSRCLGAFGLSTLTSDSQLRHIFSKYGPIESVTIIIDKKTGRSRGFGFVYFENLEDAKVAKDMCNGMDIDGRCVRVDFSIAQRAHTPTPGIYMGKPSYAYDRWRDRRYRDRRSDYYYNDRDRYRDRSYSDRDRDRDRNRGTVAKYRSSRRYERSRSRSYTPHKYR